MFWIEAQKKEVEETDSESSSDQWEKEKSGNNKEIKSNTLRVKLFLSLLHSVQEV